MADWSDSFTGLYADEAGHESKLIYMYQFISRNQQPFIIYIYVMLHFDVMLHFEHFPIFLTKINQMELAQKSYIYIYETI